MPTIGFATIAESPRDDVVPAIRRLLAAEVRTAERGCLDGLTPTEIAALGPETGEVGIVARLKAGGSTLLSHRKILPWMQRCVDELVHDEGADIVVILCGADWSEIVSDRLLVNPGKLFPSVISGLAHGRRLGIIKPSAAQIEQERARYQAMGIDAVVTAASPYAGSDRLTQARAAAAFLNEAGCDLIWMTCIGMDAAMRDAVAEVVGEPVVLAQSILGRIIGELTAATAPVAVG